MRKVNAAWCHPTIGIPDVSCVYGIYQGTKLVYIGSTINLRLRIASHKVFKTKKMRHTSVVQWIEVPIHLLRETEQRYLNALRFEDGYLNKTLLATKHRVNGELIQ